MAEYTFAGSFPASPSTGDTLLMNGVTYIYSSNGMWQVETPITFESSLSVTDGELSKNNFTDADHTKLDAIEANATADQTKADIEALGIAASSITGALPAIDGSNLTGLIANMVEDTTPQLGGNLDTQTFTVDGRDVGTDGTKLDTVETSATADQTGAEIKSAYEGESDTNAFTDADHSKLDGIASSANNYSHPTGNGNNHIPSNGAADQVLTYSSAGTATWADAAAGGAGNMTVFTASSTSWTVPDGVSQVIMTACGAGGNNGSNGGGGSGGFWRCPVEVVAGTSMTISVGQSGGTSTTISNTGTSATTTITCPGGSGGTGGSAPTGLNSSIIASKYAGAGRDGRSGAPNNGGLSIVGLCSGGAYNDASGVLQSYISGFYGNGNHGSDGSGGYAGVVIIEVM